MKIYKIKLGTWPLDRDTQNVSYDLNRIIILFLHFITLVSSQCDPALLPEPNHVMLNHLYALSIKVRNQLWALRWTAIDFKSVLMTVSPLALWQDGVMVLSATHRYKKKYVTTLLYKPIWETWHTFYIVCLTVNRNVQRCTLEVNPTLMGIN